MARLQALLQTYLSNVLSYHDLAGANEQNVQDYATAILTIRVSGRPR